MGQNDEVLSGFEPRTIRSILVTLWNICYNSNFDINKKKLRFECENEQKIEWPGRDSNPRPSDQF